MSIKIQPRYLTLNELLAGRLFRIPEYQRAYSWGSKQRKDLFDDIKMVFDKDADFHFMATIVGLRRAKKRIVTDEFNIVEVVDGQQRLTTLVMLYRAISRHLDISNPNEKKVKDEIEALLVKNDDLSLLLLQANHDYRGFYTEYIRGNSAPPPRSQAKDGPEKAIIEGIYDCEQFVTTWDNLLELAATLKNRLTFILHEIDDESSVYTVFEVLNSRGLPVAWLDRLKSILMAVAFESDTGNNQEYIKELHSIWGDIYRGIGLFRHIGSEALRFTATMKSNTQRSKVLGEEDSTEEIRNLVGSDVPKAIEYSRHLLKSVEIISQINQQPRLAAVNKIGHARFVHAAILMSNLPPDECQTLVKQWERSTFRIFGFARKDARTRVGDYVRLGHQIAQNKLSFNEVLLSLQQLAQDEYAVERVVSSLESGELNCYEGWEDELRYLLFRWEEELAQQQGEIVAEETWEKIWSKSASDSIEHIMPQSKGSKAPALNDIYIHRLGNLTLLPPGVNSSLSNKDPIDKKDSYSNQSLYITRALVGSLGKWDVAAVSSREKRIVAWAKTAWDDCKATN